MTFKNFLTILSAVVYVIVWGFSPANAADIVPAQDYDGILPAVESIINESGAGSDGEWLVFRNTMDVYLEFDSDGRPIDIESTQWCYWLAFFPDGYEVKWDGQFRDGGGGTTVHIWPQLVVDAPTIHYYRLESDEFSYPYITDEVLAAAAGQAHWEYQGVHNGVMQITKYDSPIWCMWQQAPLLNHALIASSFDIELAEDGRWMYPSADGGEVVYRPLPIGAHTFTAQSYEGYFPEGTSGGGSGSGGSGSSSTTINYTSWLSKIYNAIVDGFDSVLEKMTGGAYDEDVKEDTEDAKDKGNSILKFIQGLFGTDSEGGDLGGSLDDFGGIVQDGSDEFQNSEEWGGVSSFFQFMNQLWSCLPPPVTSFIVMSVCLFMMFAVLKLLL